MAQINLLEAFKMILNDIDTLAPGTVLLKL